MKRILVIEDNEAMRENITEILELAAYEVAAAPNGKQGVELARQTNPDLILCDIMMPELDGFGVLHIVQKDPALVDVPFVFLTARAEITDFRLGMNLGADDYLTKPFEDLSLLNTVALRLRKRERGQPDAAPNLAGLDNLRRAILNEEDPHQSLCENYPSMRFDRKHRLFVAGNWPTALYYISQGKVKLSQTDGIGNEYITTLRGAGEFVGYLPLLEETAYAETAELLDNATVCTIPKADFLFLLFNDQEVANRFVRTLAGDVAELRDRLLKLAYQSVRKRVAEALLMYQRKFHHHPNTIEVRRPPIHVSAASAPLPGSASNNDPAATNTSSAMNLSRENWAHLVGASTETVIRMLSDLRAEGLIEINANQITLLDMEKLAQIRR